VISSSAEKRTSWKAAIAFSEGVPHPHTPSERIRSRRPAGELTEKSHHAIVWVSGLVELESGFLFRIQWLFSPDYAVESYTILRELGGR
jgi:hypothetical protein